MLQAIIDSFPGADRNFLFLLNFDIISRKCSAVITGIQCTFFLTNDALTWKDRLHLTSRKKGPLLTKFLRNEQIILLIVIVCNSSRIIKLVVFLPFCIKKMFGERCQYLLINV